MNPTDAREALDRVLVSPDFDASERNRRFLAYVVEEALAGRGDRIKAYSIATSVFGRSSTFDAQLDPIVRIEARRLRRSLERFYLLAGTNEPIRIVIPKGGYAPVFETVSARVVAKVRAKTSEKDSRPSVFVRAFAEEEDRAGFPQLGKGFTRQVIVGLTQFEDLLVFGPDTTLAYDHDVDVTRLRRDLDVDFVLIGGISMSAGRLGVDATLVDAGSGRTLWAQAFDLALEQAAIFQARDELAGRVAQAVAQPYGVIFTSRVHEAEGRPPRALGSYHGVLRFYQYWRTHARDLHDAVRAGLEEVVAADPGYADARACLALVHVDVHRFGYGSRVDQALALERAVRLARQAIDHAPQSCRAHHALGLALWFTGGVRDALDALQRACVLNPNDTEVMAELGLRHALLAEWDAARPLLRRSFAANPAQPSGYRIGLALDHYVHGRFVDALREARQVDTPHVLYGYVLAAMAAAGCGRREEAAAAIGRILAIAPDYGALVDDDLASRHLDAELRRTIVTALRSAGLPGARPDATAPGAAEPTAPTAAEGVQQL